MVFNPQTFGKISTFNTKRDCLEPRAIHVPLQFQAPISAGGALVRSDQLDLTTFLRGVPSPFVEGLQTLIVYQNSKDGSGNLANNSFLSEFIFNSGYRVMTPGRSYTAVSILSDNAPIIQWNIYTLGALAAATNVRIDCYFTNFEIDQVHYIR